MINIRSKDPDDYLQTIHFSLDWFYNYSKFSVIFIHVLIYLCDSFSARSCIAVYVYWNLIYISNFKWNFRLWMCRFILWFLCRWNFWGSM